MVSTVVPSRGNSEGLQAELESHRLRSFVRFAKRGPVTDGELAVISAVLRAANLLTGDEAAAVASAQVRLGHAQAPLFCLVMQDGGFFTLRSRVLVLPVPSAAHVCHQSLLQHLLLSVHRIAAQLLSLGLGWSYSFVLASNPHHTASSQVLCCQTSTEHFTLRVCCILFAGPQDINHQSTVQNISFIRGPFCHACSWAVAM